MDMRFPYSVSLDWKRHIEASKWCWFNAGSGGIDFDWQYAASDGSTQGMYVYRFKDPTVAFQFKLAFL